MGIWGCFWLRSLILIKIREYLSPFLLLKKKLYDNIYIVMNNNDCNDRCKRPSAVERKGKGEGVGNKNDACLYRMEDGRMFTDYGNRCEQYLEAKNRNELTSHNMRMWLMNNAENIMRENRESAINQGACSSCKPENKVTGTMLPEHSKTTCNAQYCTFDVTDEGGLGLGVSHGN